MKIQLSSVMVDNQAKARKFYTEVLGFVVSKDTPMGEANWLTMVSTEGPAEIELLLNRSNQDWDSGQAGVRSPTVREGVGASTRPDGRASDTPGVPMLCGLI